MKAAKRARAESTARRPAAVAVPKPANPRWPYALGLGLALFAAFLIYSPAMRGPFVFDDPYLPFLNPNSGRSFQNWIIGVRPMLMVTYWMNYSASGTDPYPYKIVNLLFHFGSSVLVWLILSKLLSWAGAEKSLRRILAVFGGLLFLVHPIQTESVAYVASRSENQSVFLFNAAFALFLYRRSVAISWRVSAGILILLAAAFLTKEHTAVLPAVLLLTDYFWNPGFSVSGIRRNWRLYVPTAAGAVGGAVFLYFWVLRSATTAGFGMRDLGPLDYFFSQCRAVWVYVRMFFLPYGQNVDHDFPISHGILDHGAILGLAALIAVTAAAWIYRRRFPLASYGWFAFLILLAPTSSFVPIKDLLVERRLYLPFIGLVLICCEFLRRLHADRKVVAGALAAVLVLFSILTFQRNGLWSNDLALWQDAASKSPQKVRPQFQVAFAYYSLGQCARSADEYAKAARLATPDAALLVDWATALDCAGNETAALDKLHAAAAMSPTAHIYSQIGMVEAKQNHREQAFAALAQAERLQPNFDMTYFYRGNLFLMSQEYDRAETQFRTALALNPGNQSAANALLRLRRRFQVR
jgi:tetratricopeptide (TPR) repeat protein